MYICSIACYNVYIYIYIYIERERYCVCPGEVEDGVPARGVVETELPAWRCAEIVLRLTHTIHNTIINSNNHIGICIDQSRFLWIKVAIHTDTFSTTPCLMLRASQLRSDDMWMFMCKYIYIYIYTYRERERDTYIYIYTHVQTCCMLEDKLVRLGCSKADSLEGNVLQLEV